MAKNEHFSNFKRTKHIKNRYFMIKDKIYKGEIAIQYCPTGNMWADINTKALQGALVYKMRACLMGISKNDDDEVERLNTQPGLLTIQECATTMLAENASVITKVDTMITAITAANTGLPNATKKTTFALAVFLLRAMAQ